MKSIFLSLLFTASFTGCSSFYYYPTQNHYYFNPEKLTPPPEIVKFKSLDGTELEGWYFKSSLKKPKGMILHFHGNAQNVSTHFTYLWSSIQLGYDYFIFDYRGYGNSQGKPSPRGMVEDGQAAMRYVETLRHTRGDVPAIYFCQSLGGSICLKSMAVENEIHPEVLVIDSSFSNYRSEVRTVAAGSWLLWLLQPLGWVIADNSQSPQGDLKNLKAGHFLIVHGDSDQVVREQHGRKIFELLPEPKEYWPIPQGYHADFMVRHGGKYQIKFYAWLEHALAKK